MIEITDWAGLWRDLCLLQSRRNGNEPSGEDRWHERARHYNAKAARRWAKRDSSREAVAAKVAAVPGAALLDIGAGTGAWAAYLSSTAARITALDPSPSMLDVMRENLASQGITNVDVVEGAWPQAEVPEHDFSLCSHAMYSSPDLPLFVERMEQVTRRTCFLILRAPALDGVMAEAARRAWGHPYDSPNFQIAYNILLQMGIRANVQFEEGGAWEPWTSASLADAQADVKRRLWLQTDEHDAFLTDLLRGRLREEDGHFVWPRDMRSALVYWQAKER